MGQIKINVLKILLFVTSLSLQNCYNERIYKMPDYNIFNQKGGKFFFPYAIALNGPISEIFPVPVKDAVGTLDFDNAITVLKFNGDTTPDYDIVARNFLSEVTGDFDFGYCPVFSDDIIVYTQTRWAVVANIKTGKVESPILDRKSVV